MIVFAHDYETTGVNAKKCGVVQAALCFAKLFPDGSYEVLSKDVQLLNPGEPIPAGASNVHKIFDRHVSGAPDYELYLSEQFEVVNDTDIKAVVGYNSGKFDDVIARRCGLGDYPSIDLYTGTRRFKDLGHIPGAKLAEAYTSITGKEAMNAHDAYADIVMTLDLIKPSMALAERDTLDSFIGWLQSPWASRQMKMPYGKHKGQKLCNLPKSYVRWALENMDLTDDLKMGLEMVR